MIYKISNIPVGSCRGESASVAGTVSGKEGKAPCDMGCLRKEETVRGGPDLLHKKGRGIHKYRDLASGTQLSHFRKTSERKGGTEGR